MLTFSDPLPRRPQRILVAGTSGTGKSTLAKRIAAALGAPYTELDSLFHGPQWRPRPEFQEDVERLIAAPTWVSEWQYRQVRKQMAARADLLVWVDHPFWPLTFPRLLARTVTRRLRRQELWNGNLEGPLWTFFTDRDHIVRWGVRTRKNTRELVVQAAADHPSLVVIRLRGQSQVESWFSEVLLPSVE